MSSNYPRLNSTDIRDFVDVVVRQGVTHDAVTGFFIRKGFPGITAEESKIVQLVHEIVDASEGLTDRNAEVVEAKYASRVFLLLDQFDDAALGDEGYWSYLSVRFFWPFVAIRQRNAWLAAQGEPRDPDQPESERQKLERYLIGKDHYQIPLRMYLRAQSVREPGGDFSLAEVPGTDFWRSQILGVRTSVYPPLARAVTREQKVKELNVVQQRPPGRLVNRLRANIEFARLDEADVLPLVSEIWKLPPVDESMAEEKKPKKSTASSKTSPPRRSTS